MRITMLGVPIDAMKRPQALARAAVLLRVEAGPGALVSTPNPEMLVAAQRDPEFKEALRSAALAIPDGFGLLLVGRLRGLRIPERISGVDFLDDLAALAAREGKSVFLLGGDPGVAALAAEELVRRHPGLRLAGAASGGTLFHDDAGRIQVDTHSLRLLADARPDILFVAFGHGRQEKWIAQNLPFMPTVRLAMGVGGSFDFIAGRVSRAPKWLRSLGLEWLWRLLRDPRRIGRIFNAVVVFPLLAITRRDC